MTDDEITQFTDSLQEKLGEEQNAIIADDIGTLITKNAEAQKAYKESQAEIERLKSVNEKLVVTNGNLLKQVPVEHSNKTGKSSDEDDASVKPISLSDAFDKYGNFKH